MVNIEIIIGVIAIAVVLAIFAPLMFDPRGQLETIVCEENEFISFDGLNQPECVDRPTGTGDGRGSFANENTEFRPHLVQGTDVQDPIINFDDYQIRVLEYLPTQDGQTSWDYLVPEQYESGEDLQWTLYWFKEDGLPDLSVVPHYYEEITNCGETSTTAEIITIQDGVEFDFEEDETYLVMANTMWGGTNEDHLYQIDVRHGDTIFEGSHMIEEPVTASSSPCGTDEDVYKYFWWTLYTPNATEATQNLSIHATSGLGVPSAQQFVQETSDDAEQLVVSPFTMALTTTDMDLHDDGASFDGHASWRYQNVPIPQGSTITSATIQFEVEQTADGAIDHEPLTIDFTGHDVDDSPAHTTTAGDISNRVETNATVNWVVPDWLVVGDRGSAQLTPDLSTIVQEIVDRGGWVSGNDLTIMDISPPDDQGHRHAESDSDPNPAELTIDYFGIPPASPMLFDDITFTVIKLSDHFIEGDDYLFNLNANETALSEQPLDAEVMYDNTVDNDGAECDCSQIVIDIPIANQANMMILIGASDDSSSGEGNFFITSVDEETNTNVGFQVANQTFSGDHTMEVWRIMDSEITNKGGTNTITINFNSQFDNIGVTVSSFYNVDQNPPDDVQLTFDTGEGTTESVVITPTVDGSLIYSLGSHTGSESCDGYGSGQVELSEFQTSGQTTCSTRENPVDAGADTQSFTVSEDYIDFGIISSAYAPFEVMGSSWATSNSASISWTPENNNDEWVIFGTANYNEGSLNPEQIQTRLFVGGAESDLPEISQQTADTDEKQVHSFVRPLFLPNATITTLEVQSQISGLQTTENRTSSAIFALNLDQFSEHSAVWIESTFELDTVEFGDEVAEIIINPNTSDKDTVIISDIGWLSNTQLMEIRVQDDNVDTLPDQTSNSYDFEESINEIDLRRWTLQTVENLDNSTHTLETDASAVSTSGTEGEVIYRTMVAFTLEALEPPSPIPQTACMFLELMSVAVGEDLSSLVIPTFDTPKEACVTTAGGADILRTFTWNFNTTEIPFSAEEVGMVKLSREQSNPNEDFTGTVFGLFGELQWVFDP